MTIKIPKITTKFIRNLINFLCFALLIVGLIVGSLAASDEAGNSTAAGYINKNIDISTVILIFLIPWLSAIIIFLVARDLRVFTREDLEKALKQGQRAGIIDSKEYFSNIQAMDQLELKQRLIERENLRKQKMGMRVLNNDKLMDDPTMTAREAFETISGVSFDTRDPLNKPIYRELAEAPKVEKIDPEIIESV